MSGLGPLPRVGCLGVGWIGQARLASLLEASAAEVVGICDPSADAREKARASAPGACVVSRYEDLLELGLDGVVIATPSALHARQCLQAFERGLAVFCQKPLARTAAETEAILSAARNADRLLRVDFCYRETRALAAVRDLVQSGELGEVYAADLVFHNAYGPDKAWAQDAALAGGGCLMDLGVHLVDAALFVLGCSSFDAASARLIRQGRPLTNPQHEVEDFATARIDFSNQVSATLACSWRSSFGDHARIRAQFWGTKGSAAFVNVGGSFYDFNCELYRGTQRELRVEPPDAWGGRAIVAWAEELRASPRFRAGSQLSDVARLMDALYAQRSPTAAREERRSTLAFGSP